MKTYIMRDKTGQAFGDPVPYTPILFTAGSTTHLLALHRVQGMREWVVSHPVAGAKVCRITGHYTGVPCSSKDMTAAQARAAAMVQLDALCERFGSERFNSTIAGAL
jgi:hypothetical protein